MEDDELETPPATGAFESPAPLEEQRHTTVEGLAVRVISHAVRDRFAARVEDVSTSDIVGRARGATRDEAEGAALASASVKVGLSAARSSIRRGMEQLPNATPSEPTEHS
jgi:hypothetical protein